MKISTADGRNFSGAEKLNGIIKTIRKAPMLRLGGGGKASPTAIAVSTSSCGSSTSCSRTADHSVVKRKLGQAGRKPATRPKGRMKNLLDELQGCHRNGIYSEDRSGKITFTDEFIVAMGELTNLLQIQIVPGQYSMGKSPFSASQLKNALLWLEVGLRIAEGETGDQLPDLLGMIEELDDQGV